MEVGNKYKEATVRFYDVVSNKILQTLQALKTLKTLQTSD